MTARRRSHAVTVMAPMRNEARFIAAFVSDLANQDYTGRMEVLVADGASSDESRRVLEDAAAKRGVSLEVLGNPEETVSHGLNACIERAKGDLLVRMDCHSRYPPDYVRRCVEFADETGAAVVGGVLVPRGVTYTERAVACAMDSPFGGVAWSRLGHAGRREADTVIFGTFRREIFDVVGGYDVDLVRNQDDELSMRIRRAGGTIMLDPTITVSYTPRGSLAGVSRQYYEYGLWKVPVMLRHRHVLSGRSLAPLALVAAAAALALGSIWSELAEALFVGGVFVYLTAALAFGVRALRRRHEKMLLLPLVLATFPAFHFSYGVGLAHGLVRALSRVGVRRSKGSDVRGGGGSSDADRTGKAYRDGLDLSV